jgi:hypothetical protein
VGGSVAAVVGAVVAGGSVAAGVAGVVAPQAVRIIVATINSDRTDISFFMVKYLLILEF